MAESNDSPVNQATTASAPTNNSTSSSTSQILALLQASREKGFTIPNLPPTHSSVSPAVAAQALLDIDEEGLREELQNPGLTDEERVKVFKQLRGIESSRIWHQFQEKVTSSILAAEGETSKSEDGKKGEE